MWGGFLPRDGPLTDLNQALPTTDAGASCRNNNFVVDKGNGNSDDFGETAKTFLDNFLLGLLLTDCASNMCHVCKADLFFGAEKV